MKKQLGLLFILLFTFCSCRYSIHIEKDSKGRKHRVRDYKNYDLAQAKAEEAIFSSKYGYKVQQHSRYQGSRTFDTTRGYAFIQYDSTRVYLQDSATDLKALFAEGLLSPNIIYCCTDSACHIIKERFIMTRLNGEIINYYFAGWGGPEIRISQYEILRKVHANGTQRRFKFILHFNDSQANNVLFLELTNDKANRHTDLNTFIKGARVTFIKNGWVMI